MGKRGKNQKSSGSKNPKKMKLDRDEGVDDMHDEIDAFHKQRDKVSLDVDADNVDSDDDLDQPVFDLEGTDSDDDDDEEEDDDEEDDGSPRGQIAKLLRTQKYMKSKFPDEDEMHDDAEAEEEKEFLWGGRRHHRYGGDVGAELNSSDDELRDEEEKEARRLEEERLKFMSEDDFGYHEPSLEDIVAKRKDLPSLTKVEDDINASVEVVKKDLNALSRDEQMDVLCSAAPEVIGLLSELNDSLEQLETKVNPLLNKVAKTNSKKNGMQFLEVKQVLLLSYCQAITFYLLLKSEGQPIRDHPVIARLVEIKSLLEKIQELEVNLPSDIESSDYETVAIANLGGTKKSLTDPITESIDMNGTLSDQQEASKLQLAEVPQDPKINVIAEKGRKKGNKVIHDEQVSLQSSKMLKVRSELEAKLKQKGMLSSIEPNALGSRKYKLRASNGRLETFDDFDDDAVDLKRKGDMHVSSLSKKLSQFGSKSKKSKISGDEDLPRRDDLGERRRKHELRVLASAGIGSMDDFIDKDDNDADDDTTTNPGAKGDDMDDSEDDFYKQVKEERAERLAKKAMKYSRNNEIPTQEEHTVDGKRLIGNQIMKNRGLTRQRNKNKKNPRVNAKNKLKKVKTRRQGQVRDQRKPEGNQYGGETAGINAGVSRSIRFKS